jgi:23S rRNA-/tRNA-specific pseudouridylate synthase
MVVHPAYKNATGTVMNALLWHARDWKPPMRPSIVGRLDKLTSGVVIVAKDRGHPRRAAASADGERRGERLSRDRVRARPTSIEAESSCIWPRIGKAGAPSSRPRQPAPRA